MASAAAILTGKPADTFNAAGLNEKTVRKFPDISVDVNAYYSPTDPLSKMQDDKMKLVMPKAYGTRHALPMPASDVVAALKKTLESDEATVARDRATVAADEAVMKKDQSDIFNLPALAKLPSDILKWKDDLKQLAKGIVTQEINKLKLDHGMVMVIGGIDSQARQLGCIK